MKILITGGNGQLGNELMDAFHRSQHQIFSPSREELPLETLNDIDRILYQYSPDLIIHGAAYTAVDTAETERKLANVVNHLATAKIAEYAVTTKTKLIYISTDYVFDGHSSIPLSEDFPTSPINYYGRTKLEGEIAVTHICPDAITIRTSWVYSKCGRNFVKTMMKLMAEKPQIKVVNDQIGSPTYAKDLAYAIRSIIESKLWIEGTYHYSNEGGISWFDFAYAIKSLGGFNCEVVGISTEDYPTAARRPNYSLLNTSKIKITYGIETPFWLDSLKKCIVDIKPLVSIMMKGIIFSAMSKYPLTSTHIGCKQTTHACI